MIGVVSEVDKLRKVLVHSPDDGIEMITPDNALRFLYDDIVFLPKMKEEHQLFTSVLSAFVGERNVLDTYVLLEDVLRENPKSAKEKLLTYVFALENLCVADQEKVQHLSPQELAYTLFTGILREENRLVLPPLPNYVFTRDIGITIKNWIVVCNASKKARTRESILTRCILYHHPVFQSVWKNDRLIDMTKLGDDYTLEGGDVMMLDQNNLIIGCSERTTPEAVEALKNILFQKGIVQHVIRVVIPKDRACMHIDTLFTLVSHNDLVIYEDTLRSDLIKVTQYDVDGSVREYSRLESFFLAWNPDIQFILCGNGQSPHAEREQWTDGCNLVAVKDGVAVAYDRNQYTAEAFEVAGYTMLDVHDFLENVKKAHALNKTIITIPSTELSRARGGPHCMTFPVERERS